MANQETPRRVFERRSPLSFSSTPVHDTATTNSKESDVQAEESQASMSQTIPGGALQLETICRASEGRFPELAFVLGHTGSDKAQTLTITQRELHCHPPFGHTSRIHIVFTGNDYTVNILGLPFLSGTVHSDTDVYNLCEMFSDQSLYKFCPGIDFNQYKEHYHRVIRYHLKSVRQCTAPFKRVDSVNCKLCFTLPANAPLSEKFSKEVLCPACRKLKLNLDWQRKRTASESPSRKIKRQAASSKAKLTYMSPASQLKRKQNVLMERNSDKRKLSKYQATEVTLSEEQHEEMSTVVNRIEEMSKDELEKVLAEGDAHGVGAQIREIWATDRREQSEQFSEDQARNSVLST